MAIVTMKNNFKATYSAGTAQDAVLIPAPENYAAPRYVVQLEIPASGEGKVQGTSSSVDDIVAGTAVWFDWDSGSITSSAQAPLRYPPTALRAYRTSGTIVLQISAR